MKLEFVEKMTKESNGTTYVRESYSIGGYAVDVDSTFYADGNSYFDVRCRVIEDGRFLPAIYYKDAWLGGGEPTFEIQTTSYGPLKPAEYKKFLAAQQKALEVAEVLTREFIEIDEG